MPNVLLDTEILGWEDFDQAHVEQLSLNGTQAGVDSSPLGGMFCPLLNHGEWLGWQDGDVRNGTIWHEGVEVSFSPLPTYVFRNPEDNVIAGNRLVREVLDGRWGNLAALELGHENSVAALTWNVFRSLQEAGKLSWMIQQLAKVKLTSQPELSLWGRQIGAYETSEWRGFDLARERVEPWGRQQTEPDCCICVPGQALIFIDAQFARPETTNGSESARDDWFERYSGTCPGLFDRDSIRAIPPGLFPERLLSNVALANRMRRPGEHVTVVALTRASDQTEADALARRCLCQGTGVHVRGATWEDIYHELPDCPELLSLRTYLQRKSLSLQHAFAFREESLLV